MTRIAFGFAATLVLGMASFTAPASAANAQASGITSPMTDVSSQGYVRKSVTVRRGPLCTVRTVRTRGPMGRVVVRKTRVCR